MMWGRLAPRWTFRLGPRLRFRLGLRWQIALLGTCGVLLVGGTVGFNENSGLEGNLREAVHQIEARLAEFDEPRLTILMLMMRRHEKDFLLRGDEKYGADITKRGEVFVKALDASPIGAPRNRPRMVGASGGSSAVRSLKSGRSAVSRLTRVRSARSSLGSFLASPSTSARNSAGETSTGEWNSAGASLRARANSRSAEATSPSRSSVSPR